MYDCKPRRWGDMIRMCEKNITAMRAACNAARTDAAEYDLAQLIALQRALKRTRRDYFTANDAVEFSNRCHLYR